MQSDADVVLLSDLLSKLLYYSFPVLISLFCPLLLFIYLFVQLEVMPPPTVLLSLLFFND